MDGVKIDAIRHYLSRDNTIIQGFLGQQNPTLLFENGDKGLKIVIYEGLETEAMYSPGNFGIDMYFPFSVLSEICEYMDNIGILPAKVGYIRRFNPAGTERGPKTVPSVLRSMGRFSYEKSATKGIDNSYWYSEGGYFYIDVETQGAYGHNIWKENPVMEPFELHFGIRGDRARYDPFYGSSVPLQNNMIHFTEINEKNAAIFLGSLLLLKSICDYNIVHIKNSVYNFILKINDDTYNIKKKYKKT